MSPERTHSIKKHHTSGWYQKRLDDFRVYIRMLGERKKEAVTAQEELSNTLDSIFLGVSDKNKLLQALKGYIDQRTIEIYSLEDMSQKMVEQNSLEIIKMATLKLRKMHLVKFQPHTIAAFDTEVQNMKQHLFSFLQPVQLETMKSSSKDAVYNEINAMCLYMNHRLFDTTSVRK